MDALPYEAQTALVSFVAATLIGGSVSFFGAPAVAGATRVAVEFALRRRFLTGLGVSVVTALGTALTRFGASEEAVAVSSIAGTF